MKAYYMATTDVISNIYDEDIFPLIDSLYYNVDDLVKELKKCLGNLFNQAIVDLNNCQTILSNLKEDAISNLNTIINKASIYDGLVNKYENKKNCKVRINDKGLIEYSELIEKYLLGIVISSESSPYRIIPEMENYRGDFYN